MHEHTEGQATWLQMVALLSEAASRGLGDPGLDPVQHSQALGALLVASSAIALLPADAATAEPLGPGLAIPDMDQLALIRAAEQLTRRHAIEALPAGASGVIVALCDLLGESAA